MSLQTEYLEFLNKIAEAGTRLANTKYEKDKRKLTDKEVFYDIVVMLLYYTDTVTEFELIYQQVDLIERWFSSKLIPGMRLYI